MWFKRLSLRQFRNIEGQTLNLNPGLNVFRGQNGQGKTNLVEALYLLTHGQSFRTNRWNDFLNKANPEGFYIAGELQQTDFNSTIEIKQLGDKRSLTLNQKRISTPKLKQHFPSLLFSPESLLIVKDSPQKRRDLIDDLCLSLFPSFASIFAIYKKAFRQKNVLLKKVRDSKISETEGRRINENLTEIMLAQGARITAFRIRAIAEIESLLLDEFLKIMDEHYGNIAIRYGISGEFIKDQKESDLRNAMFKRWDQLKEREWASGLCLVGPHKHDIQFNFNGQEARFFCSQGQQRAIILAFKMAQTRLHYRAHREFPILLLDDVLSELDREKQMRFVNYLLSTEAQIFLTTTDATSIPQVASRSVFEVKDGVFGESDRLLTGGLSV